MGSPFSQGQPFASVPLGATLFRDDLFHSGLVFAQGQPLCPRDNPCAAKVVPEGVVEALRRLFDGIGHPLGAGPILDPIF